MQHSGLVFSAPVVSFSLHPEFKHLLINPPFTLTEDVRKTNQCYVCTYKEFDFTFYVALGVLQRDKIRTKTVRLVKKTRNLGVDDVQKVCRRTKRSTR